jgi:diadenosine tetraphosphate (Ap4A) HIT family hydrolase
MNNAAHAAAQQVMHFDVHVVRRGWPKWAWFEQGEASRRNNILSEHKISRSNNMQKGGDKYRVGIKEDARK